VSTVLKFKYYETPCNVKIIQTGDILRVPQVDFDCRYPKYNNFSNRSDLADLLEHPCFESSINFAARVFGREASHLRLITTSACKR